MGTRSSDDFDLDLSWNGEEATEIVGEKAARITEGILRSEIAGSVPAPANVLQEGLLQLGAALSLVDTRVDVEEVERIKMGATFRLRSVPSVSVEKAAEIVKFFRNPNVSIGAITNQLKKLLSADDVESLVDLLFDVAIADGIFHPMEKEFLQNIHTLLDSDKVRFENHIRACRTLEFDRTVNIDLTAFRRNIPAIAFTNGLAHAFGMNERCDYGINTIFDDFNVSTVGDLAEISERDLIDCIYENIPRRSVARAVVRNLKQLRRYVNKNFSEEETERFHSIIDSLKLNQEQLSLSVHSFSPEKVLVQYFLGADIITVCDLLMVNEKEFCELRGFGQKKLAILREFKNNLLENLRSNDGGLSEGLGGSPMITSNQSSLFVSDNTLKGDLANDPISVLNPSPLLHGSLTRLGVRTCGNLAEMTKSRFSSLKGVGRKKLRELISLRQRALEHCFGVGEDNEQEPAEWHVGRRVGFADLPYELTVRLSESKRLGQIDLSLPINILHPPSGLQRILERDGQKLTCEDLLNLTTKDFAKLKGAGRTKSQEFKVWKESAFVALLEEDHLASRNLTGNLDDWMVEILGRLERTDRETIIDRFINQLTLAQIAENEGITREGCRQREVRALQRFTELANRKSLQYFKDFSIQIESKKLVPLSDVDQFLPKGVGYTDPNMLILLLQVLGVQSSQWNGFLSTLTGIERERLLAEIKTRLREVGQSQISVRDAGVIVSDIGLSLSHAGLCKLMDAAWQVEVDEGVLNIPWQPQGFQISEVVRRLGRPVKLEEIDEYLVAIGELDLYSRAAGSKRNYLQSALDVFSYGHGIYLHRDYLEIPESEVVDVVQFCLAYLRKDGREVSTKKLLKAYEKERGVSAKMTPHLLKDFLSRREDILTFNATINVALKEVYEEGPQRKLLDHLEEVLLRLGRPSSLDDVVDEMEKRVTYSRTSIYAALLSAKPVVRPRNGWFQHIDTLGLAPDQRSAVLTEALLHLPESGEAITATALVERMDTDLLKGSKDPATVVFALCGSDERFETATGQLIAATTQGESHLLSHLVESLLRSLGVAFPRELFQELCAEGFRGKDRHISAALQRGMADERIGNLPGGGYYLLGEPEVVLKHWRKRRDVIFDASRHSDVERVPGELAWGIIEFVVRECVPDPELIRQFLKRHDLALPLREAAMKALEEFERGYVVEPKTNLKNVDILFGLLTSSQ